MLTAIATFLVKIGLSSIVDKTIGLMEKRAELENDKERLRTQVSIEHLKSIVEEARLMTSYNEKKLNFSWFWILVTLFIFPYAAWWNAVILDSIFHFGWKIADLPTEEMKDAAAQMIQWLFYVGGGVAAWKALK